MNTSLELAIQESRIVGRAICQTQLSPTADIDIQTCGLIARAPLF
jgi:hypothetical protein